jgi:hypothetical protein
MPPPAGAEPSEEREKDEDRELTFSFDPPGNPVVSQEESEGPALTFPLEQQSGLNSSEEDGPSPMESEAQESFSAEAETLSIKPYLTLFCVLVLGYFLAVVFHATRPQSVEGILRKVPWIGSSVFRNSHLKRGITFESLRPGFYRIVGNREVFVISGMAVNQNPVGVREVQVEGAVYDSAGKEIEKHAISIGNPISARIIRDLTAQEVSILQRLNPQKSFEISPEQSREFAIVFLKPKGQEIAGFTLRVSAARETT